MNFVIAVKIKLAFFLLLCSLYLAVLLTQKSLPKHIHMLVHQYRDKEKFMLRKILFYITGIKKKNSHTKTKSNPLTKTNEYYLYMTKGSPLYKHRRADLSAQTREL